MSVIMSLISVYALYYCTWQEGHSYKTHASNVTLVTTILLKVFRLSGMPFAGCKEQSSWMICAAACVV